jgi:hypothetical protein
LDRQAIRFTAEYRIAIGDHPNKAAVAVHSINLGYLTQLQNTSVLLTKSRYLGSVFTKETEIEL